MRNWPSLWDDRRGAVAPTVALSLVGLIAVGGLAVDYARLESLDTELQQAADQAALGAVTQLDQQSGAIARATAAAQGLLSNNTLFAIGSQMKQAGVEGWDEKVEQRALQLGLAQEEVDKLVGNIDRYNP